MSEDAVKRAALLALAAAAMPIVMLLTSALETLESIYPVRKRLVRRGWLGYSAPDADAIRECGECGYEGVLRVDKHRPAPMGPSNWALFCPDCNEEWDGPLHADEAAEYVAACSSDPMRAMLKLGGYGAFKAVRRHNSKDALPVARIRELEAAVHRGGRHA